MCDLRESPLILTALGGDCHHLLSQSRELKLRGAHTCEAASLGLELCAGDAEKGAVVGVLRL